MKRIPITGADCDPSGAFHLHKDQIAAVGGVAEGERIIVYLADDESIEFEAVVVLHPSWPSYFFAREAGALPTSDET